MTCPDCGGTGLTGEQVYERLSNEGGIYLDVLCPACQDVDDGEAVLAAPECPVCHGPCLEYSG